MADDKDQSQKTEEPTAKRLADARQRGDVPKSQEISAFVILAAGAAVIAIFGAPTSNAIAARLQDFLATPHLIDAHTVATRPFWGGLMGGMGLVIALPGLILIIAAIAGHVAQTGPILSGERLKPNLSKLNPLEGAKRVFGPAAAANFGKGVGKLVIVGGAIVWVLWPRRDDLVRIVGLDMAAVLGVAKSAALSVFFAALAIYALLAMADYLGQRHSFMQRQRMTKQEIKDEFKQTEGDPHVRARLRQIRQERAQRRMIQEVPRATVVVTNPTHYAVALRYVQGETPAPVCLAKGVDEVALRIREVAEEHDVPIVEDPPLARALFSAAELDETIPVAHYKAAAKIIGYVLTLAQRRGRPKR